MQSTWFCFIQAVWCLATSAGEMDGRCWLCCSGLPDGLHQAWSALTVAHFPSGSSLGRFAVGLFPWEHPPG